MIVAAGSYEPMAARFRGHAFESGGFETCSSTGNINAQGAFARRRRPAAPFAPSHSEEISMTSTIEPTSQIAAGGNKLRGRVAFVTGGTRGIGAAISRSLASQGATVAAGYGRNTAQADQFLADLNEKGRKDVRYSVHRGDVANADDCRRTIDEVIDTHGRLDILVNNAGITIDRTVLKMQDEDWDTVLGVNLSGASFLAQAALRHMP